MPENLGTSLLKYLPEITFRKTAEMGLANARDNLAYIEHTVAELDPSQTNQTCDLAMVMSAGPSLHRKDPIKLIKEHQFSRPLIAADSAMAYCLRNGVVPDYVVSVDPHPTRIVRWFGDKYLGHRPQDEYFDRQELDPTMHRIGSDWNQELIDLVDRYGPRIKAIISTSSPASVRDRCIESGMDLYWWNPMYDDYEKPNSLSKKIYDLTKAPCMITGGNVGTSAWVFTAAILRAPKVVLTGMDLSYPPGNPLPNTQYYTELLELFGERIQEAYIDVYNPHLDETWYTDPTYYWYRQGFLELAQQAPCITYNCTEGGILFGQGIEFMNLGSFFHRELS